MSSSGKRRPLTEEVLVTAEEIRAHRSFTERDLDLLLSQLETEHFEGQLHELIGALGSTPLRVAGSPRDPRRKAGLPTGSRISRQYLREIEPYRAMTREAEIRYSKRMEFVAARLETAAFQSRAERRLRRHEYEAVRDDFVQRNLHLVVAQVYSYRTYGVPLDDLVQEGNTALIRAVEKFDWRKEVRFRTYVAYWVRQAVERHLASQKGAVRVPHHLQQKYRRLKREGKLPKTSEQDLSVAQVAAAFEISHSAAGHLLEATRPSYSLEQALSDEGDSQRDHLIAEWEPTERDQMSRLRNRIGDLIDELDEREQRVLTMRFGLQDGEIFTLEEVGRALNLSRERSRQIQQQALGKLRKAAEGSRLEDYL